MSNATTGIIEGIVVDEAGEILPGVTVTLINTATNLERVLITNEGGRFRGLSLPVGPYRVTASVLGFQTLVREGIELTQGQSIDLRFVLEITTIEEVGTTQTRANRV